MIKEVKERYEKMRQTFSFVDVDKNTKYVQKYQYTDTKKQTWNLQDKVDVKKSVRVWCDQFQNVAHNTVFIIFGVGNVQYLIELYNRFPQNPILFYEPCEENLLRIAMDERFEQILTYENIILIGGANRLRHLEEMLYTIVRYENMGETKYAAVPNYAKIWEDEYQQFVSICKYANQKRIMDRNTLIIYQNQRIENYIYHLKRCLLESDLRHLQQTLCGKDLKKYPAVIISAGPSLDKNIDILGAYHGRAFIVCVDAALNTALKHNIVPDMIVSVDSIIKEIKALKSKKYAHLPFTITMSNSKCMVEDYHGRLFYEIDRDSYTAQITGIDAKNNIGMESGGSVANNAFSLVYILGFKKIILIGQDLAYPNNKLHAKDAFENEKDLDMSDGKYFYVEDIYGGKVLSESNMCMYREWFEKRIENYKDIEVIDATEGGALIQGTKIMPLSQALEMCCPKERIDFRKKIEKAGYLYDEQERKAAEAKLQELPQEMDRIIERLKREKKNYETLDILNRKGKYKTKEFKRCTEKIKEFTEYMDKTPEVQLMVRLVYKDSYEMRENIEKDEDNIYEDIKKIVDNGLKMTDAYIEAGEKIKELWKKYY